MCFHENVYKSLILILYEKYLVNTEVQSPISTNLKRKQKTHKN